MSELKEIRVILGAPNNASAKQLVTAIEKLQNDYKAILIDFETLNANHEAQCALGHEYTKFQDDLQEVLGCGPGEVLKVVGKLIAEKGELEEMIPELEGQLKEALAKIGQDDKEVISLQNVANTFLNEHNAVNEIYVTQDGSVFLQHSFANNHSKVVGGKVVQFKR